MTDFEKDLINQLNAISSRLSWLLFWLFLISISLMTIAQKIN